MFSLDFEIIKIIVQKLSELFVIFKEDLKKGVIKNIKQESDIVFNKFIKDNSGINNIITLDPYYGINFILTIQTGKILFPAVLFNNPFKFQILKELKYFFKREITFEEFQLFISEKVLSTDDKKKGGFSKRILELLRFYIIYFDKVIDVDVKKFIPHFTDYISKYTNFEESTLQMNFSLTQKYSRYLLLPKFANFEINSILVRNETVNNKMLEEIKTLPFVLLFNNQKHREFSFYFTKYNTKFKSNFIERICFFENLDLYYEEPALKKLTNKTMDILNLYFDYKDGIFNDTSISFEIDFLKNQKYTNQIDDLDLLIHLFNTRKLPNFHEIHPISKYLITYRNKLVNFYSTINYFIYIYDPKSRTIAKYSTLFLKLLRNTFANGYIIQGKPIFLFQLFYLNRILKVRSNHYLNLFIHLNIKLKFSKI